MLQVSNNSAFTSIAATFIQAETLPETRIDQGYSFLHSRTYYWRVRAMHTADGTDMSNWSATQTFRTPAPPAAPAPPPRRHLVLRRRPVGAVVVAARVVATWASAAAATATILRNALKPDTRSTGRSGVSLDHAQSEHAVPPRSPDRARQVQGAPGRMERQARGPAHSATTSSPISRRPMPGWRRHRVRVRRHERHGST